MIKWPGWQRPGDHVPIPREYWERMRTEWAAADRVMVNSEWSRTALIQQSVPAVKLFVAPINFDPPPNLKPSSPATGEVFTVLWLGSVSLRKGIQYLVEAARLLQHCPRIQFLVAGGSQSCVPSMAHSPADTQQFTKSYSARKLKPA